jgi:hypothetical protein
MSPETMELRARVQGIGAGARRGDQQEIVLMSGGAA